MKPFHLALTVVVGFAGGFLARGERPGAQEAPVKASEVALEHGPDEEHAPQAVAGHAPGSALLPAGDGKTVAEVADKVTLLDARDPAAMVMAPAEAGQSPCPADPPCACSEDDLHRYKLPKPRRKDLESLPPAKTKS